VTDQDITLPGLSYSVPALTDQEAADHLAACGMTPSQIEAAAKFHRNLPLLVTLAAGAFQRGIEFDWTLVETLKGLFHRGCSTLLDTLDMAALGDLIQFSACLPGDLRNGFVPPPGQSTLKLASDCGWLLRSSWDGELSLLKIACDNISEIHHDLVVAAHDWICGQFESREENLGMLAINGLEHARLAGEAPRMERYLRHRLVLADCIKFTGSALIERLLPLRTSNPFLDRICEEYGEHLPQHNAPLPMERVDALLAPKRQWPESSGVPAALAGNFRGRGIRILLPVTDWNQAHPEFLGRPVFPSVPPDAEGSGTGFGSIIAGLHIGVAPDALIEPFIVSQPAEKRLGRSGRTRWIRDLVEALSRSMEDPPDIVCLTTSFIISNQADPGLHSIIREMVERDILVIAAAGNGGNEKGSGELSEPGIYPEVLSVGFCDFEGRVDVHSSRGTSTGFTPPRTVPDIYGYGVDVYTADGDEGYATRSGSAYAAAYVAGIAALYAQAMGIRGDSLKQLLINTADPVTRIARFAMTTDADPSL